MFSFEALSRSPRTAFACLKGFETSEGAARRQPWWLLIGRSTKFLLGELHQVFTGSPINSIRHFCDRPRTPYNCQFGKIVPPWVCQSLGDALGLELWLFLCLMLAVICRILDISKYMRVYELYGCIWRYVKVCIYRYIKVYKGIWRYMQIYGIY